jgi:hypothetical protein
MEPTVLEDPTGRRARWLRRAGRLVFVVFLAWLLAIVLGGLGLTPVPGIPFTHALRPSSGPPPLVKLPRPRPPTVSDLRPALSAAAFAALARAGQRTSVGSPGRRASAPGQVRARPGQSSLAPGQTKTAPAGSVTHGHSTTAPGQTRTAPGQTKTAPGQTKTTPVGAVTRGRSTTAPGQTTTTTKSRRP